MLQTTTESRSKASISSTTKAPEKRGIWRDKGFEAFRQGTFGNGGQNLYVSREGVLQRIFRFDVTNSGHTDLLFANSHDFGERPPAYILDNAPASFKPRELLTHGAYAAAVADLNGDGFDDLIIAGQDNGLHKDLTACLYYGSPEGFSERYKYELPAPDCRDVAVGDFNGDGRLDIAFILGEDKLRIFYQGVSGFMPTDYCDHRIALTHLAAGDLDGDGCSELYVRVRNGKWRILWGNPKGIDPECFTEFGNAIDEADLQYRGSGNLLAILEGRRPKIVTLENRPCLFYPGENQTQFIPVSSNRTLEEPLTLETGPVLSVAVGDIRGSGYQDIVFTTRQKRDGHEVSWIYWGSSDGYSTDRRTAFTTSNARDVALADLHGQGYLSILVCQGRAEERLTTESLIYTAVATGIKKEPIRIMTHDAVDVLVAHKPTSKIPDAVFVNHSSSKGLGQQNIYVYLGSKDGYKQDRRIELPGHSAAEIIPCDFNQDGWPDLLVINNGEDQPHLNPPSYLYFGGPEGFSPNRRQEIPTRLSWGGVVGDINRDGYLELITGGTNDSQLRIFYGTKDGFDTTHYDVVELGVKPELIRCVLWPILADFNNDGWLDLFIPMASNNQSMILWGGPDGFSKDRATFLPVEKARSARVADLTGNGWLDLVIGTYPSRSRCVEHDCSLMIYWGGPQGYGTDRCSMLPAYQTNSIAIADFNRDGILDIFVGSYLHSRERDLDSYIYWGQPGGLYSPRFRTRLFAHSVSGCFAADLDGDGWVDLAVAQHRSYGSHVSESVIWWNGPEGFSEKKRTWLPTVGPHGMCSVEPGNIMDRGPEEYFISRPKQLPTGDLDLLMTWTADIPAKTSVRAQMRFASTPKKLNSAQWKGMDHVNKYLQSGNCLHKKASEGCWAQYRLALGAVNSGNTPRVYEVAIEYQVK